MILSPAAGLPVIESRIFAEGVINSAVIVEFKLILGFFEGGFIFENMSM